MQTLDCDLNRRVLIVDDNEAIHDDFRKILAGQETNPRLAGAAAALFGEAQRTASPMRYEVASAYQGEEGFKMVAGAAKDGRPFALAFVDMRMPPGWDGVETIEHLWREDPELQVVICTAYSDYSWTQITDRLGHSDRLLILKKPFDHTEICQMASALTEKWSLARQARLKMEEMDRMVAERTVELKETNKRLAKEMDERMRAAEQLREKEEQLRQKHKLEAIGSLAGGVAHEFNNLLQVIRGYTTFAMEQLTEDSQTHEDLRQVIEAVDRAVAITRQLLDFSRRGPTQKSAHEINDIVASTLEMLRPVLGERIELDISLSEDAGCALVDVGIIAQAVMNLCVNARDAMPSGGRLVIATESAQLPDRRGGNDQPQPDLPPGDYTVVIVTDTGCGMTSDVQQRIFDPFFTTKDIGKGTGMGLAMVYGAVQQHDGTITVESRVGEGTTFRIYLPWVHRFDESTARDPDRKEENDCAGMETILIAEDEPVVRALADRILRRAGYAVIASVDGEDAISKFDEHADDISLALLDVGMPKMSGREVYHHLKRRKPHIGLVFCTGYDPETGQTEFIQEEDLRLLSKPFAPEALLRTVREVLNDVRQCVNHGQQDQPNENCLLSQ